MLLSADGMGVADLDRLDRHEIFGAVTVSGVSEVVSQPTVLESGAGDDLFSGVEDEALPGGAEAAIAPTAVAVQPVTPMGPETGAADVAVDADETAFSTTETAATTLGTTSLTGQADTLSAQLTTTLHAGNGPPEGENAAKTSTSTLNFADNLDRARVYSADTIDSGSNFNDPAAGRVALDASLTLEIGALKITATTSGDFSQLQNLFNGTGLSLTFAGTIQIDEFLALSGTFTINTPVSQTVTVNTGVASSPTISGVAVSTWSITATGVHAFVGIGGPDRIDTGDGLITSADPVNPDAVGFAIDGLDIALVVMKTTSPIANPTTSIPENHSFYALKATAASAGLVGTSFLEAAATGIAITLNTGNAWLASTVVPVVDFNASFGIGGYTPAGSSFAITATARILSASATNVLLKVGDFVFLSGGLSLTKGETETVDVRTGLNSAQAGVQLAGLTTSATDTGSVGRNTDGSMIWNLPVETLTFGLSGMDVFVGYSDSLDTIAADGDLTQAELNSVNAIGVFLDEVTVGLAVMRALPVSGAIALNAAGLKFTSLRIDAGTIALLGIPEFTLIGTNFQVRVNTGGPTTGVWGTAGVTPPPVVDFATSYPTGTHATADAGRTDGYRVATNTSGAYQALYYDQGVIGASADRVLLRVSDFVYISGGFSFNKGRVEYVDVRTNLNSTQATTVLGTLKGTNTGNTGTTLGASADGSMIYNLPIQTIEMGMSNVDVFVGYTDPSSNVLETAARSTGELTEANLQAASAIGLFLDEANMGLLLGSAMPVTGAGTLNAARLKFFSLQANASNLGLVGVPEIQLAAQGAEVRINQGSFLPSWPNVAGVGAPPVVDFKLSFPDNSAGGTNDSDTDPDGYRVATNTSGAYTALLFDQPLIAGGAEKVTIRISEFVYLTGSIYFEKGPVINAPLVAGLAGALPVGVPTEFGGTGTKSIQTMTIGATNVNAFVGLNGPYWVDSASGPNRNGLIDRDGSGNIIAAEVNGRAQGIVIDNLTFGLFLGTPTNPLDPVRYVALKANANAIKLVGIDGITATANGIAIELNLSSPAVGGLPVLPVINFNALAGNKYGVKTGAKDGSGNDITVDLTMSTPLIRAQGFVHLNILNSVYLSGTIAFELGPTKSVMLSGGGSKTVTTMSVGAANVNAFVGANGPYWVDTNNDKAVQSGELSSNAVGFSITNLNAGLLVMASTNVNDVGAYVALKASVTQFGLVNMPSGFTATGAFDVELNVGFGLSGLSPNISPVDLAASFSEAPALFALMDTNGDKVLDQTEQNAGLAGGYIGQSITTAAQLVSILNASNGPPDAYLTISEVRTKLKDSFETSHQAAITALDADNNSRLNTGFEVFGKTATPIVLDSDSFLISVQLGGQITLAGVFRMNGVFLFEVDSSGLKAFVAAGLEVGPDIGAASGNKIFTMNALGALVINRAGIAADVEVSAAIGSGALRSVLSLSASARVLLNTTGVDQIITIPQRYAGYVTGTQSIVGALPGSASFDPAQSAALAGKLAGRFTTNPDGSLRFTIGGSAPRLGGGFDAAGSYFMVALHGNLTIARTFIISGDFQLKVSAQGLQLGYNGTLDMGGFATVSVAGGAVIENGVFAAYARLAINIRVGGNPGVHITGGADFEINSGTASKTVYDALGTGHAIAGTTYMVSVAANINLFNVLTATGTVKIGIVGGNFLIDVNGTLSFFGILNVGISGYINTNGTFSFTGSLVLDLTYGGFGIRGSISVTLNNSGFSGSGSVALVIAGQNINVASGAVSVNWSTGAWLIRAEGPLSVWLEVSSNGQGGYTIDGGLGFFDDVLEVLGTVANAIADGAVAAANAVANAAIALGGAIVQFGQDVVDFFSDVGDAIANAAEAVWDTISGWFEDERNIVTQHTVTPRDYYQYSTSLVGGTLTINNGSSYGYAQQLNVWVVDGNVIVDAPDYTKSVVVSTSQRQERDYEWDGWPPWGQWSDWYNVGALQTQYANINVTNASSFALGFVNKIVVIGTDNSETIVLDRNTININADVYGNGGDDVIATGKGNDRVWGGNGNDTIFTYEGNDALYGESGNDKLFGGLGNDLLDGGAGDDLLDENKDRLNPGTIILETNTLIGGSGNDTLLGSPGRDTINGGSGNDILLGLSHDDTYVFNNGYGTDRFVDYNFKETLDFSGATDALTVSMPTTPNIGLTATAGSGNSLSIDDLVWIELLKLGSGSDQVTITDLPDRLFTITDAGGSDLVTVDDSADTANNTGVLTSSRLTGLGMGNADQAVVESSLGIAYSNIEDMVISLGSGNDTFTINSTTSGTSNKTTLNTGAGTDTIHINSASDTLTVNGQGHADTINVNGTSAGSAVTLNGGDDNDIINVNSTGGATTANGGNGSDTFHVSGTGAGSTTTLNGDAGSDIINVKAIAGATTANGGNDADTINVGSNAAGVVGNTGNNSGGTVDNIGASLTINGDASGSDVLNVDDTGDGNANIGTLTLNAITGLDMAGSITYQTIEALHLNLGSVGDTLTIGSTHAGLTHVEGRNGNDQIFVQNISGRTEVLTQNGSDTITVTNTVAGANTVNGIQALLVVTGGSDTDALIVTELNEAAAATQPGTLTNNLLTGLGMAAAGGVNYTEFETLDITLGLGGDTFNIQSTFGATVTTLKTGTGSGANIVNVGSLAPATGGNVNAMDGKLIINGQSSSDTVNVDDRSDTAGNTALLTSTRLTGLGMAANDAAKGIEYAGLETLDISLGSGNDDFTIQSTHAGSTTVNTLGGADRFAINGTSGLTTVNLGDHNDTVNVGSAATLTTNSGGTLNGIQGGLTLNGGGGTDTLNFDETNDAADNIGTLTSNTLTGLGMVAAGVTYTGAETFNLNLGSGGDQLTIVSTHAGLTHLEGRDGGDQFFVRTIAGLTEIAAQNGADTITVGNGTLGAYHTVNGIQASLVVSGGTDGGDTLNVTELNEPAGGNSSGTLTTTTLTGLGMAAAGITYTQFETLDVTLGGGDDTLIISSTHTTATTVHAGAGHDQVNIATIAGATRIEGQAGDDTVRVNVNADGTERKSGPATINGVGAYLDLDGQAGSDTYIVYLAGAAHSASHTTSLINVNDTGGDGTGVNLLEIYGTDNASVTDNFLIRRNFIALLPANSGTAERINYNGTMNGGVAMYGRAGDDRFVFDDNSASMTVDGGDGNDTFQIGQMFQSERVPTPVALATGGTAGAPVAAGDSVTTVHTTQGYLTPGVRFATTIYGGDGNDQFVIMSNQGTLGLFGEDGNDKFTVRAFALYGSQAGDPNRAGTNINAGLGSDDVEYNVNAPVAIDGGDGFDTVVVVGTEFSDRFVITSEGVYGAGLFVTFTGIEALEIDGAEGNDHFTVLSTPPGVVTQIYGGRGSDTFSVGGNAGPVVSRDLQGHSGLIENLVVSSDVSYNGIDVTGVAVDVGDNDAPGVVFTQSGGATVVAEVDYGIGLRIDTYTVVLTTRPTSDVYLTASAPVGSLRDQAADKRSVQLSTSPTGTPGRGVELKFTPDNWNTPQTVYVHAVDDTAAEGVRYALIPHSISMTSAAGFGGLALPNVSVTVIDNDTAGTVLLPLAGNTIGSTIIGTVNPLLEGSTTVSSQSFLLIATQAPAAGETVTVTVSGGTQLGAGTSTFNFTANAGQAQLVTITANADGVVEGAHRGVITTSVSSTGGNYTAAAGTQYEVPIADTDSPGVLVLPSNGNTRAIEGGAAGVPGRDSYQVVLTQAPTAAVQVRILAVPTPTTNAQLVATTQGNAANQATLDSIVPQVQVSSSAAGSTTVTENGKTYLVLTFTSANWSTPQEVVVAAIDDATADGGDIQAFGRILQTVDGIRGPLLIDGGINPVASTEIPTPLLYRGETNPQQHVSQPNPNFTAIESDQIDSLWVYNDNALAVQSGTLTSSRLTGLGMGSSVTQGTTVYGGGITYANLEMLSLYLGSGADTFEVISTHAGETLIDLGGGHDALSIRSALGHTTLLGGAGNDAFTLGTPGATNLTIDQLRALLTIDGGAGTDTLTVDDRSDANNNLGTLDTSTLTGLDLGETIVRTFEVANVIGGSFTLTVGTKSVTLPVASTADAVRTALLSLQIPGVLDVTVNRAGNIFTAGFLALESVSSIAFATSEQVVGSPGANTVNRVQRIALPAASGTFTVNVGATAAFNLTVGDSADVVRAKIIAAINPGNVAANMPGGYGIKDVMVAQYGSTYEVTFQGLLSGDRGLPFTFAVAPTSTATATSFSLNAIGGTFRLNLNGVTAQTSPLAWNASAAEVAAVLGGLLGSPNITVAKAGSTYTVNFGGHTATIASVDHRNLVAPIAVEARSSGINYYGIDTLNLHLGSGSDVLNIRGTTAVTNVFAHNGDDRVYVSSLANETLTSVTTTDFLRGNLDRVLGTLNLDLGAGRHSLMISDEAAIAGDGTTINPVRITDQPVAAVGVPASTEISITGLTPAPALTYRASPTGNFADGITIWTGWGADTIHVNGTHQRGTGATGDLRTVTTLNTGLGNDTVTVDLDNPDGFFVLNTQGPENAYVGLLSDADDVDASASSRPLIIFGGQDSDLIRGGTGGDIIFGDRGLVTYYSGNPAVAVTVLGNGGPGDRTDGVERPLGRVETTSVGVGGNDIVYGLEGRDIVFGGLGNDILDASASDVADDILVGDNGQAIFTNGIITQVDTTATSLGGDDTITAGKGANIAFGGVGNDTITAGGDNLRDVLVGDNGTAKFQDGQLIEIFTSAPDHAGADTLTTGDGSSVVFGGSFSDLITTGAGDDIVVGDNGRAVFSPANGFRVSLVVTDIPDKGTVPLRTIDDVLYDDVISAGEGRNVIFGGSHNDHITTLSGDDMVVGDNGKATFHDNGVLATIETASVSYGGNDRIQTGRGADVVFGGSGADGIDSGSVAENDVSRDVIVGDNGSANFDGARNLVSVTTNEFGTGGNDIILIGGGDNVAFGGVGADSITAGAGNNVIVGDNGSASFAAGSTSLAKVTTLESGHGGDDTIIAGLGNNVVLGGSGGDRITLGSGDNIALGDNGYVDYVARDGNTADIDVITSTDTGVGGVDRITTGSGADIVIGGQDGDFIDAGDGNNLVFGDSATITAATADAANFSTQPLTLGLVTTIADGVGGIDEITTGVGRDIIFGGTARDIIVANFGETLALSDAGNIVIGDNGLIDYVRAERDAGLPGADLDPSDIDVIMSMTTSDGGNDHITTGAGFDLIIGGQGDDTILAGGGDNIVVGDSAIVTAAGQIENRFAVHPLTIGRIETTAFNVGGVDTITTGSGNDIVIGGDEGDVLKAGNGDNIVIGDDAAVDYTRFERGGTAPGADSNAGDIDFITSLSTDLGGGGDDITTGTGNDIVIGGRSGDVLRAGAGNNIVIGDSGDIIAADENGSRFLTAALVQLTLGRITTTEAGDGGVDTITTGVGYDIILGGMAGDRIIANDGDATVADAANIIIGDNGYIDYTRADRPAAGPGADTDPSDIDVIASLDFTDGGVDRITTGAGADIIIGGQAGDVILAGEGTNVVIGDSGVVTAANEVGTRFATHAMTVGRIETTSFGNGGVDEITTGAASDVVLGGHDGDIILAGDGNNVVLGDDGVIDYARGDRLVTEPGSDTNAADIDLISSVSTNNHGGADRITTGTGNDIVIGGRFGDTITAGTGNNIVLGDSGDIIAAISDGSRFGGGPLALITLGRIETTRPDDGGVDIITTGIGYDIILGGMAGDQIIANDGDATGADAANIIIGDNGYIDYTRGDRANAGRGSDTNPADIDVIASTYFADGGDDRITTGAGADIIIGGQAADTIVAGEGTNIVIGDSGMITAANQDENRFSTHAMTIGRIESVSFVNGGNDDITTGSASDVVLGGFGDDTLKAGDGHNIVVGDDAEIDYVRSDASVALPGSDSSAADIDLISSVSTNAHGGADLIITGTGNDIIIGGRFGDTITAGTGNNIVLGDSGDIIAAISDGSRFGVGPLALITVGRIVTTAPGDGGIDIITTGVGQDIILGGTAGDTITANSGESAATPDAGNIILGDDGEIDYVRGDRGHSGQGADGDPSDIDFIGSLDPADGAKDIITTGVAADIIIGGAGGDDIQAGNGNNLVIGDSGFITAAVEDLNRFPSHRITVGKIATSDFGIGGADKITTGIHNDLILGGHEGDTLDAGQGDNVVLGDDGAVDFTRANRDGGNGADGNAADIDFITSLSTTFAGGADTIDTGDGHDIIIGGRAGDTIRAQGGRNIVIGDSGIITAAGEDNNRFGSFGITIGFLTTIEHGDGGIDSITTLAGNDVILGGHLRDIIHAGEGDNVVLGDDGAIDYVRLERLPAGSVEPGADTNASDIDFITSLSSDLFGGNDEIDTGDGNDIVIGGRDGDTIRARGGRNLVIGDSGRITAATENLNRFGTQAITVGLVETMTPEHGGADTITTLAGNDVILGGHMGDTINAGDGDNVVLGDDGIVDYVRAERIAAGTPLPMGADTDASDIDWITSTSTTGAGGADIITTGVGNDLVIGGRLGDHITDLGGDDIIVGDSAAITAADANTARFGTQAITLGRVETIAPADGGNDTIFGGPGNDIILGGAAADTINGEAGNDVIFGDNAELTFANGLLLRGATIANEIGGADVIRGQEGHDILIGGAAGDRIDGGAGEDLVVGDNAIIDRTGRVELNANSTSLLHQTVGTSGLIYDIFGNVQVTDIPRNEPGGSPLWADFVLTLVDHSLAEQTAPTNRFGNDYLAGGAGDDRIFGGLGNDTIQGDGSIDRPGLPDVSAQRVGGVLTVVPALEATSDGDDYIEGNGGNDIIFGGLGQDDIIGGSSEFFGLTSSALRPDGADLIFGGAGTATDIARLSNGDVGADARGRDADTIAGDNANIIRILNADGTYARFAYDNPQYGSVKLVVRAFEWLDYTPGVTVTSTNGAADEIHGESGNDTIYGQVGNDILFGEGQDDDIIGGTGNDWISGGNGDDGILGDDGRMYTSRNGTAEPLYGIAAIPQGGLDAKIGTPSKHQQATINVANELKKTAILEPFTLVGNDPNLPGTTPSNDIIFGGLGDDALHGGAGDDAMSGAEALPAYYANPFNPGNILGYNATTGEFAAYNELAPSSKIWVNAAGAFVAAGTAGAVPFILNFDASELDGNDVLFGDTGNDWLVGGRGNDNLWGGYGDDLMNVDDNHDTAGGANTAIDPGPEADLAFGGAGRDILIGNSKNDRLIDWNGEFNSYVVPFQPFGEPSVSRELAPALIEFLYKLSASDGADPTRSAKVPGATAVRNGEPYGEIGLVKSGDTDWNAQQGAPADPQPGNGGGASTGKGGKG